MNPLAQYKNSNLFHSHITIFFLLSGSILPIGSLFFIPDINQLCESSIGSDEIKSIKRLKENLATTLSSSSQENNAFNNLKTLKSPILTIGKQVGNGEGIYQVYDSLIKINSSSLDTQDRSIGEIKGNPSEHNTTLTLSPLTDFSISTLDMVIQDVTAEEDWRSIENETSEAFNATSTEGWLEVGQKFNITDNYANITSVEVFLKYFDVNSGGDFPHGNISIFTEDSGKPSTQLGTTTLEEGFGSPPWNWGSPIGPAWVTYTFPKPINVTKGSYWLVLNDTGNHAEGYWEWYGQNDLTNGDAGDCAAKSTHDGTWQLVAFPEVDILSAIRVLSTDVNWDRLIYSNPQEVSMTYNTDYELNSFSFKANNTESHDFSTNTSVSFTIQSRANYSFSYNPLTASAKYQVQNGSIAFWNLTFSTIKVNTTDLIQNRHIAINGIQADWNGSKIYWNNSKSPEYTDLINNVNVTWDGNPSNKYTYGNTTMVINASELIENVTWTVLFNATNYLSSFILEHHSTPISLPFRANVTDIIDLNYQVGEPFGNASYWIEYKSTGAEVVSKLNISYSNTLVSDSWDINNTLDQTKNINGTYDLQVFWISMDKVKVGTFTRTIDLFVNTSFNVQFDTEVIVDNFLNITAVYKSIHNDTDVTNAQIWCDANWTTATDVKMNQIPTDHSYNATFATKDQIPGTTGTVTITTQVAWFVNWTKVISVNFVENSSLIVNTTNVVLEWCENTTLRVDYNKTDGTGIDGATITVAGVNITRSTDVYFIQLNSTQFPGTGNYPDVVIKANKVGFHTRKWYFNLTIISARTNLTANIGMTPILNNSGGFSTKLSQGSSDSFTLNVQIYHVVNGELFNSSEPFVDSPVPLLNDPHQESNFSWSFIFDPEQSGVFDIRLEFEQQYYTSSNFVFQLEILKASTSIVSNLNTPENIYFTDSIEFFFLLNNTDYNELITGGFPNINASSIVTFVNSTGNYYWFRFDSSSLQLGFQAVNITFSHPEFESSNTILIFNVIQMPTANISLAEIHMTNNGTVQIEEDLAITIDAYHTYQGIEIAHLDTIELWLNSSSVPSNTYTMEIEQTPFKIIFQTVGWKFGSYTMNIQISTLGYQAQVIQLNITLSGIPIEISVDIEPGKNIQEGQNVKFIVTLGYQTDSQLGFGAGVNQQIPLSGINVSFFIGIKYKNDTVKILNHITQTDETGKAVFTIEGHKTKAAAGFTNVTIQSGAGLSGLQSSYSLPASELATIRILSPATDIFQIIGTVLMIVAVLLFGGIAIGASVQFIQRKRKTRKTLIHTHDMAVEQSFDDIKSIRLILARHESGLQFYVEKTLSEFQTDPDALSGMSTAISSFIGDVAGNMQTRGAETTSKKSIETISREGFYMLIWNGKYSSIIIISEAQLPEYFKERLTALGQELEETFKDQLKDIFTTEQFPNSIIKKMVRKHISLHYFSAFALNEGILTLKNVKLSRKAKKMLSLIKKIHLEKNGLFYLFSEQIISHLERKYKRSEAIEFLEKAINWNLLIELTQEEQEKLMS